MPRSDATLRDELLDAAERQLIASPDGEIATRAVCRAAGVTQTVLYRLFGDKRGLLDALGGRGLHRYAARKAALESSSDPVADLIAGWDDHMAFATENPALYQLMFAPRPWVAGHARDGVSELLDRVLTRCAAAGALRVPVASAAAILLSSNVGLALNRMADPERFGARAVIEAIRDGVFASILRGDAGSAAAHPGPRPLPLAATAAQLQAQLATEPASALGDAEVALLDVWLERMQAP